MNPKIRLVLRAAPTLAFWVVSNSAAIAASDPGTQAAPNGSFVHQTKPYVLFMGADLTVEKDKVYNPVLEVTDTVVVIRGADGNPVNMPLDKNVALQLSGRLKIATSSVDISDMKTDRAYSPEADPFRTLAGFNNAAAGASAVEDLARGTLLRDQGKLSATAAGTGAAAQQAQAQLSQDQAAVDSASEQTASATSMVGNAAAKEETALSGGTYDAIRVSFAVTPQSDLAKGYIAIIAHIQDGAGNEKPWFHLESMGPMAAGVTRKVNVYQTGLPSGYTLGKCEVHLYDGRSELATSLSSNRIPLTKDEMLDFRVIEYVAANQGRTLPAVPATFVSDMRSSLSPAELNQACYVRVAKDGRVAAIFSDKDGTVPVQDSALDTAMKGLRFKPAIDAGKPVESIVAIRLGMLGGR